MNSNSKKTDKEKPNSKNNGSQSNNDKNPESFQIGKASKTSFIWILILVSAVFLSNFFTNQSGEEIEVQYSQYRSFLNPFSNNFLKFVPHNSKDSNNFIKLAPNRHLHE